MYELNVSSRRQLERANLRAQARKPRIEQVGYGMYKVFSTNPATPFTQYATGIERAKDGNGYDVCCSCPTTRALCLHVSACFPHFLMTEKQQTEPAPAGLVVQGVITTSIQEIDHLIEQAIEESTEDDEVQAEAERLYPDLLKPIYQADNEYKAARLQAEQALAALAASGFQPSMPGEETQSMDRECPKCGLVQPDDDSTDCLACRAILDHEDIFGFAPARRERVKEEW